MLWFPVGSGKAQHFCCACSYKAVVTTADTVWQVLFMLLAQEVMGSSASNLWQAPLLRTAMPERILLALPLAVQFPASHYQLWQTATSALWAADTLVPAVSTVPDGADLAEVQLLDSSCSSALQPAPAPSPCRSQTHPHQPTSPRQQQQPCNPTQQRSVAHPVCSTIQCTPVGHWDHIYSTPRKLMNSESLKMSHRAWLPFFTAWSKKHHFFPDPDLIPRNQCCEDMQPAKHSAQETLPHERWWTLCTGSTRRFPWGTETGFRAAFIQCCQRYAGAASRSRLQSSSWPCNPWILPTPSDKPSGCSTSHMGSAPKTAQFSLHKRGCVCDMQDDEHLQLPLIPFARTACSAACQSSLMKRWAYHEEQWTEGRWR